MQPAIFRKLVLSLFFTALHFICAAQQVTRVVQDQFSKKGIPFATVKVLNANRGTIASANGEFHLEIFENDSLFVFAVGYLLKKISCRNPEREIFLEPLVRTMDTIVVRHTISLGTIVLGNGKDMLHKTHRCPHDKKKDNCIPWGPANAKEEFAERINLPDPSRIYKIKTVYIPTRKDDEYGPVLIRIYDHDTISQKPGEALFVRLVNVSKKDIYKNKVRVNLSEQDLLFQGGTSFYVSVGWPDGPVKKRPAILALFEQDTKNTFSRSLTTKEYQWVSFGRATNQDGTSRRNTGTAYAVELEQLIRK